ncbi:acyl-CoA thioesterase [Achromobacter pestifer]|uniref:Acyl-CoA thioesterase n=1 Tax=Achromobacter pestifer TaxID=1353889 RepID=A0A7D4DXZ7_9BURK|nr:thioesterase family protein [Achromobacter pestifer]QKH36488.1 acyl-CoA thioesterase [Achromobacter pestifer]
MPRLLFEPRSHYPYATEVQIYAGHINYGGHLDHAQLITLVSEARVRYINSLGYHEQDIEGHHFVVADLALQYKSESHRGEVLRIEIAPANFNKYGFDLEFHLTEKQSGRAVATGKAGLVCIDNATRKVSPISTLDVDWGVGTRRDQPVCP